MLKYSAIGPNANAGKKLNAPIKKITNMSKNTNIPLLVDNVPEVVAIFFFFARLPAMASTANKGKNLATSIHIARIMFKNTVSEWTPAKDEPLFAPLDVNIYKNSENL